MLSAYQQPIQSDPTTDFIEALGQNEISVNVDLNLPSKDPAWFIRAISIIATQDRAYELWVFSSATNLDGTITGDKFIAYYQFATKSAGPPATAGSSVDFVGLSPADTHVRYYVDGLMIPYYDADFQSAPSGANPKIHCRLINRSATAKSAGAAGALQVTFYTAVQGMQV